MPRRHFSTGWLVVSTMLPRLRWRLAPGHLLCGPNHSLSFGDPRASRIDQPPHVLAQLLYGSLAGVGRRCHEAVLSESVGRKIAVQYISSPSSSCDNSQKIVAIYCPPGFAVLYTI